MEQMSREELIALIQQLDSQYYVLNERVQDIRDKQIKNLNRQIKAKEYIRKIDAENGMLTCPACFDKIQLDVDFCPRCGEEL